MRKIGLAFAAGVAGVAVFAGSGSAQALTFNNDPCLDLSQIQICERGTLYGFAKPAGPTLNPCGMPWQSRVVGSC
ncbi:hypothetical protein [Streptomyces acidiscabies]|uniref:DUF333 domain-containing protein n=1 Tax=Streptomyces acidiscabies TaxID=42234 RepID=A0AAP6BJ48_9ACTN|nr:hypothetical protein [Streptomyces acidiscabies]MBP5938219.1 hypothetical protein [Streptomyces sp. LBUM 1476]MBZ3909237.1 hypothetical protein [Streptomyces acidiscabies]MDX2965711.1 hypothetical protein [Streptomyces acidiscabies]MDX3016356.1 hypothetical protein [Streptomyces acidiscabies]MDX3788738.1 hypothetical protein [Streptomyces acidiscabies]